MAVYVDPLFEWPLELTAPAARAVARRNGGLWCHLVADSIEELHGFADRIGLPRALIQGGAKVVHFDLTPGMRRRAVCFGAVEITPLRAAEIFREQRKQAARRRGVDYCRECGCTDDRACEGGCHWVEPDLCSQCAGVGV